MLSIVPRFSAWIYTVPSFAAEHASSRYAAPAPAAVDRYLLPAESSVANLAAAVDRWDGQTDGHPTVT